MATVAVQEPMPVRSRVNLSAIFAGAVVALAVYLLLSLLGIALELSVSPRVTDEQLGIGAAAYALVTLLISLFCGGFIVSQCTVGETGGEAAIYGIIMWGVVFAFLLWLTTTGLSLGFNAVMSVASATNTGASASGSSDADLQSVIEKVGPQKEGESNTAYARRVSQEMGSKTRNLALDKRAVPAAWWTFAGVLFSMLAAMFGAICGSGPQVVVAGFPVRTRFVLPGRRAVVVNK